MTLVNHQDIALGMLENHWRCAYLAACERIVDFSDKRILDVGCGNGKFTELISNIRNINKIVGIDPAAGDRKISGRCQLRRLDASSLPYADETFDLAISGGSLEHVNNPGEVLREIYRVLKPGGLFLPLFGPIWSSAQGHHICISVDGNLYTFNNSRMIPDFSHLLFDKSRMFDCLRKRYGKLAAERGIYWIYESDSLNRLFYGDYIRIFRDSRFKVAAVEHKGETGLNAGLYRRLRRRYPMNRNFKTSQLFVKLVKN